MVEIEFRDATPEKFGVAMKKLAKGVDEAGKGRLPEALKLFQDVLAVITENVDALKFSYPLPDEGPITISNLALFPKLAFRK